MGAKFRLETAPSSGSPYFELIGSDGVQRWSTRDKLFRATDLLRGSISFSSRSTPINTVTSTSIGSCSSAANFVLGYMKASSISLQPGQLSPFPAVGDWYYVSGSYLGLAGGGASNSVCVYTFLASGGAVTIEEQLAIYTVQNDFGQTFPFPAFTLDYELWAGTFA